MQHATLMTPAAYAKSRGLHRSTITREVQRGQIPSVKGMIDPEAADKARRENLHLRGRKDPPAASDTEMVHRQRLADTAAASSDEFVKGAMWLADELCSSARRAWPEFVSTLTFADPSAKAAVSAAMIHLLERWAKGFLVGTQLPAINWASYGDQAEDVARQAERLMTEWSTE